MGITVPHLLVGGTMEAFMDVKQFGEKLVGACREGKNSEFIQAHYHDDIESVEASDPPGGQRVTKGKSAVLEKNQWWVDNHEIHRAEAEGPFPHGDDRFAVVFDYDVTFKPKNQRMTMKEVAVFEVKDSKVTREEFFYTA